MSSFFADLEGAEAGTQLETASLLRRLKYNSDGLIPAIAQDAESGDVLMMAWMNRQAIEETLSQKQVCYWSRSRKQFWRKGEQSGHVQRLVGLSVDCDGDTLLLQVEQTGGACHTNRRSCFYINVTETEATVTSSRP